MHANGANAPKTNSNNVDTLGKVMNSLKVD